MIEHTSARRANKDDFPMGLDVILVAQRLCAEAALHPAIRPKPDMELLLTPTETVFSELRPLRLLQLKVEVFARLIPILPRFVVPIRRMRDT